MSRVIMSNYQSELYDKLKAYLVWDSKNKKMILSEEANEEAKDAFVRSNIITEKSGLWINVLNDKDRMTEHYEIMLEEEYDKTCRIQLEKWSDHFEITCGIYGEMLHTAFCNADSIVATKKYLDMKEELMCFIELGGLEREHHSDFYEYFTEKYN